MSNGAPGGIFALDLGSTVGWAYGTDARACPAWGTWNLSGIKNLAESYVQVENELTDAIALHRPSRIVFEAPLVAVNRPNDPKIPRLHLGLAAMVEATCYRESVWCQEEHQGTVRKLVLGKGSFRQPMRAAPRANGTGNIKAEVRAWAEEFGWGAICSEHALDAAVMFRFAMMTRTKPR